MQSTQECPWLRPSSSQLQLQLPAEPVLGGSRDGSFKRSGSCYPCRGHAPAQTWDALGMDQQRRARFASQSKIVEITKALNFIAKTDAKVHSARSLPKAFGTNMKIPLV